MSNTEQPVSRMKDCIYCDEMFMVCSGRNIIMCKEEICAKCTIFKSRSEQKRNRKKPISQIRSEYAQLAADMGTSDVIKQLEDLLVRLKSDATDVITFDESEHDKNKYLEQQAVAKAIQNIKTKGL